MLDYHVVEVCTRKKGRGGLRIEYRRVLTVETHEESELPVGILRQRRGTRTYELENKLSFAASASVFQGLDHEK